MDKSEYKHISLVNDRLSWWDKPLMYHRLVYFYFFFSEHCLYSKLLLALIGSCSFSFRSLVACEWLSLYNNLNYKTSVLIT